MGSRILDARNLLCPLPVIRVQQRIGAMEHGDELLVLATDPGVLVDIPAWCRVHGHRILDTTETGRGYRIHIRVEKSSQST